MLTVLIYVIVAVLAVFVLAGAVVLGGTFVRRHRAGKAGGAPDDKPSRSRVEPRHALLNPPARVGVEFVSALCGFPGLGWLVSGKVVTGIVLLIGGFSVVWGAVPAYLIISGKIVGDPYSTIRYLPVLAIVSAGTLGIRHLRLKSTGGQRRAEAES